MSERLAVFIPIRRGTNGHLAQCIQSLGAIGNFELRVWDEPPGDSALLPEAVAEFFREMECRASWALLMFPSDTWPGPDHAAVKNAQHFSSGSLPRALPDSVAGGRDLLAALEAVPPTVDACALTVIGCEDGALQLARASAIEIRLARIRRGNFLPPINERNIVAHLPQFPIVFQPLSGWLLDRGRFRLAMEAAQQSTDGLNRRIFLRARTERDTSEALKAFEVLFKHYSTYEELAPLDEVMKHLPYTFEGRPEVKEWERLLDVQIGLIRPNGVWDEEGYYSERAPVMTSATAATFKAMCFMQPRATWLAEQCRARGYKRVADIGASDGINLAHLVQFAPEISWVGIDVSRVCVLHGLACAQEAGLTLDLRHVESLSLGDHSFDAVSLFEVLEHQHAPESVRSAAESWVKPGGQVFITTPCGAWSLHNDDTYVVDLRKEHIRAWTVERMTRLLEQRGTEVKVERVENPSTFENNAWCFASYVPESSLEDPKPYRPSKWLGVERRRAKEVKQ